MNDFHVEEIAAILEYSDTEDNSRIPQEVFDVIYSLGRDAGNEEEFQYAYRILLMLCKRKNRYVRAYAILGLSLLAGSGTMQRDIIIPIILRELQAADGWSKAKIMAAVDDLNFKLGWDIEI